MFEKWKQLFSQDSKDKKMKPIHYFIILLGTGIAFMIFTDFLSVDTERNGDLGFGQVSTEKQEPQEEVPALGKNLSNDVIREYENAYEVKLAEILESIIGVGQVDVMVTVDSTPEIVIEKNRENRTSTTQETDKDRATRNQNDQSHNEQVVLVNGKSLEQPVVVKTLKPKVRGVLVVAKGAENVQVKAWITEAVQKVLEVPAYKISILPKKG